MVVLLALIWMSRVFQYVIFKGLWKTWLGSDMQKVYEKQQIECQNFLPLTYYLLGFFLITKGSKIGNRWYSSQATLNLSQMLIPFQCPTLLQRFHLRQGCYVKRRMVFFFKVFLQGLYILYISRRNPNDQLISYDHCYFQSKCGVTLSPTPVLYGTHNRTIPFLFSDDSKNLFLQFSFARWLFS